MQREVALFLCKPCCLWLHRMGFVFRCLPELKIPCLVPEDGRYKYVIYTGYNIAAVIPSQKLKARTPFFKSLLCYGEVVHKSKFWVMGTFRIAGQCVCLWSTVEEMSSPQAQLRLSCSSVPLPGWSSLLLLTRGHLRKIQALEHTQYHLLPPLMLGLQSVSSNWSVCPLRLQ